MASSKISELVDGGSFLPGDDTIIVRNGANFKVDPTKNAVQAWVNFNGTGTVAIRASYNVSSITDNGTGQYTVNFTTAMVDANYSCVYSGGITSATSESMRQDGSQSTTATATIQSLNEPQTAYKDFNFVSVAIIR